MQGLKANAMLSVVNLVDHAVRGEGERTALRKVRLGVVVNPEDASSL
jgi:hypothetical protein